MCRLTPSATSGFVTVNRSSNVDCPVAGAETTSAVAGSTRVSGMGSFKGVPFTSVPNGAGFAGVADEVDWSGSVIWYNVSLFPLTNTSPNENTFDLNFDVIFGPVPAAENPGIGDISLSVKCVSSHADGPFANVKRPVGKAIVNV